MATDVASFVALLAVAALVAIGAERIRVPAAVLLVALGALAGSFVHLKAPFAFGPTLFFVFLPPLIFEAAWNLDIRRLRRHVWRFALLAIPGTIFSALCVGALVADVGALPFATALVLGAIVSATDPIAVVAIFRKVAVPRSIVTLVEAESLANDGVAVVLYSIALTAAQGGAFALAPAIAHGVAAVLFGILVGIACAIPFWWILRSAYAAEHEVTITIALAYASYLIADQLGLSGIFGTVAAAVALRVLLARAPHMSNRDDVDRFWTTLAFLANATIFLATGLAIDVPRALHEPELVIAAIVALAFARTVLAVGAAREGRARVTIFLAGMRGALPLALALGLPQSLAQRAAIVDGVFAVVLVTVVLQGASLGPILTRLYGSSKPRSQAAGAIVAPVASQIGP